MIKDQEEAVTVLRVEGRALDATGTELRARDLPHFTGDEPPARGGHDRGPTPLELVLGGLCACTTVSTARMAQKLRFSYSRLETVAEGELDTRGRKGEADVSVHYRAVRLLITLETDETDVRLDRLASLVARFCPVDSLMRAAVPDYEVTWRRG